MKKLIFFLLVLFSIIFTNRLNAYSFDSQNDSLYLGGETLGMKLDTGVTVSKTYSITEGIKIIKPWSEASLQVGDIITEYNTIKIKESNDLLKAIEESNGKRSSLKFERNGKEYEAKITPYINNNTFSLGIYVKDNVLGVGTLTYILKDTKLFGSLGHQIEGVKASTGVIYDASVNKIKKSVSGEAGSLIAKIGTHELGYIEKNSITGIHGTYNASCNDKRLVKIKKRTEIKLGEAQIITTLDGGKPEAYDILITSLEKQNEKSIKGIHFKVNDSRLINKAGGIVQGMSGSPIVQDDKLIGAVTHVVVSSPLEGYGIYIEFMLKEMDVEVI